MKIESFLITNLNYENLKIYFDLIFFFKFFIYTLVVTSSDSAQHRFSMNTGRFFFVYKFKYRNWVDPLHLTLSIALKYYPTVLSHENLVLEDLWPHLRYYKINNVHQVIPLASDKTEHTSQNAILSQGNMLCPIAS